MKKVTVACLAATLLLGCRSTHAEVHNTDRPIGELEPLNDYVVDIKVSSQKIEGSAEGGVFLWFLKMGANEYAEYMSYSGIGFAPLDALVGDGRLGEIKRAAVRQACEAGNCDVIAYPVFEWDEEDFFFMKRYKVTVHGYAGNLKEIRNVPRNVVPGTLQLGHPDGNYVPEGNRFRVNGSGSVNFSIGQNGASARPSSEVSSSASPSPSRFGWEG